MAGDLEDFLRRAAARRQAKAAPAPPAQQPNVAPQYTDRRRERMVTSQEPDELEDVSTVSNRLEQQRAQIQAAKEKARQVAAEAAATPAAMPTRTKSGRVETTNTANAQDLIDLLKQPQGIRNAILLREIFDRPEHRW
ncbi:MAG: hypothetical protein AAGA03_11640 [Planctomycetota bacterium]